MAKEIPKGFVSWLKKRLSDQGNMDKIDLVGNYDSGITIEENKTQFEQKFGFFFKQILPKMNVKERKVKEAQEHLEAHKNHLEERFGIEIKLV